MVSKPAFVVRDEQAEPVHRPGERLGAQRLQKPVEQGPGGGHRPVGEQVDLGAQHQFERAARVLVTLPFDLVGGGTGA